jgi:hypothetical protein
MNTFAVCICMCDGSCGHHLGQYPSGFDAVLRAMELFPQARRISATRQTPKPAPKTTPQTAMNTTTNPHSPTATAPSAAQPCAPVKKASPRYTCEQLGVCQGLDLVCTSCKPFAKHPAHEFAPGTITTDPAGLLPGDKTQRRSLVRYMLISVGITLGTMLASGFAGYLWAVSK